MRGPRCERIQDDPAADGGAGIFFAQDEAIAAEHRERLAQDELRVGGLLWLQRLAPVEPDDLADRLGCPGVDAHRGVADERAPGGGTQLDPGVEAVGDAIEGGVADALTALHGTVLDAGEVQRNALAVSRLLDCASVHLHAAHARFAASWQDAHRGPRRDAAGGGGAGHHHAMAVHDEGAIDRQAKAALRRRARIAAHGAAEGVAQRLKALARHRRHLDHRRVCQSGAVDQNLDLLAHRAPPFGVDQVHLGDRHHAAARPEQVQNVEVLLGLRHHAVVGRHDQQDEIDAVRAGQHVADEALVPGHVDHAGFDSAGIEVREAEIDRDTALALLLQPIGVDAGQRLDERRLAVVDVAGSSENDVHAEGSKGPRVRGSKGMQLQRRSILGPLDPWTLGPFLGPSNPRTLEPSSAPGRAHA